MVTTVALLVRIEAKKHAAHCIRIQFCALRFLQVDISDTPKNPRF
jgi:hypothetical protein